LECLEFGAERIQFLGFIWLNTAGTLGTPGTFGTLGTPGTLSTLFHKFPHQNLFIINKCLLFIIFVPDNSLIMLFQPVLMFFDVSGGELLVIILVVFLVFGPQKMPEIARKIGRTMNQVKKATNDLTREFREETSGLRNEILNGQNQIKDEINSANQEISKTRARVVKSLTITDEPVEKEKPETINESGPTPSAPEIPGQAEIVG
jgi:TatA/E family protein of Tat protein translocase